MNEREWPGSPTGVSVKMNVKRRFYAIFLSLSLVLLQGSMCAQGMQYSSKRGAFKSFASTVGGDVVHVFSSPLRFTRGDGLKILALTAIGTGFVMLLDERLDENFIERDAFYVKPAIELAKVGDVYDQVSSTLVLATLSAPMLVGGLIFEDKKLLQTTRLMVESFFISGAITALAKRVFGRSRPFAGQGPTEFDPVKFPSAREIRSFPSGHTTSAFSMMTVLAKQYDQWWIKIPAYTVAVSVGLERIDSRNHWGADIVIGGVIGYAVGSTLVNRYKQQSGALSMAPYIFGNRVGIALSF